MTIDLSQFVDKEVHITLRGGEEFVTTIKKHENEEEYSYPFYFIHPFGEQVNYSQSGCHGFRHLDIIKIKLRNSEPMNESLKCETVIGIADAMIPEVIRYVESHKRYAELMFSLMDEFMTQNLGSLNENVKGELSCFMMDRILLRSTKS